MRSRLLNKPVIGKKGKREKGKKRELGAKIRQEMTEIGSETGYKTLGRLTER